MLEVFATREPTAICAMALISGRMGRYPNTINDNYGVCDAVSPCFGVSACVCV